LAELKRGLDSFHRFFERFQRITGGSFYDLQAPARLAPFESSGSHDQFLAEVARLRQAFLDNMNDDFNTGGAVGVLNELLTALNRFADARQLEGGKPDATAVADFRRGAGVLKELSHILGLFREAPGSGTGKNDALVGELIQLLIDLRAQVRKEKNFALGDQIRNRLRELGVTLEDRPGGTGWRLGS
jgi:cysteinyl-tRNA synthetase